MNILILIRLDRIDFGDICMDASDLVCVCRLIDCSERVWARGHMGQLKLVAYSKRDMLYFGQ